MRDSPHSPAAPGGVWSADVRPRSPRTVNVVPAFRVKSMASTTRKAKNDHNGMRRKNANANVTTTTTATATAAIDRHTTAQPVNDNQCGQTNRCGKDAFCQEKAGAPYICLCKYTREILPRGEECIAKTPSGNTNGTLSKSDLTRILSQTPITPSPTTQNTPFTTVVLAIALSSATFIFVVMVIACWLRRRHLVKRGIHSDNIFCFWQRPKLCLGLQALGKTSVLDNQQFTANPNYYTTPPEMALLKSLLHLEISGDKLVFLDVIGEGCFGKVFKGVFHKNETEMSDVAVKVLKEDSSNEIQVDFLREVEIMSSFDHENILALLGVVLIENGCTPWMVFEYMEYGDLAEVLRENSPYFWNTANICCKITKTDLSHLATQIASGMTYLSSQHFVHRDLATRNCLVGKQLVVKISDFGMSRDIYTCDYYKIGGSRMLPVRWMSPESVMYGKFTLESDIWSFGVVLWEIFAYGKQPYYGHSNEEVVKLIRQGILLTPPEDCPHHICQLMKMCWKTNPYDRVKFPDIHTMLVRRVTLEDPVAVGGGGSCATATGQQCSSSSRPDIRGPVVTDGRICQTQVNAGGATSTDAVDHENYLVPRCANNGE